MLNYPFKETQRDDHHSPEDYENMPTVNPNHWKRHQETYAEYNARFNHFQAAKTRNIRKESWEEVNAKLELEVIAASVPSVPHG
ncbi:hypothetical protein SRHO_G00087520 [Serrasalmus rhombeus]